MAEMKMLSKSNDDLCYEFDSVSSSSDSSSSSSSDYYDSSLSSSGYDYGYYEFDDSSTNEHEIIFWDIDDDTYNNLSGKENSDNEEESNDDNFKSLIPNISNRALLYEKVKSLFDDQYALFNRTIIPENHWIFENKLENFKLNVEDIDRLYFYRETHDIILSVRIKPVVGNEILYVIFSEYRASELWNHDVFRDKWDKFQAKYGWILITSNPHFFIEHITDDENRKKFICEFLYNDDGNKKKEQCYYPNYNITKNNNNDTKNYLKNVRKNMLEKMNYPKILKLSMMNNVTTKDFGFYTFSYDYYVDWYDSKIFNKFDNSFITEVKLLYITKYINDFESRISRNCYHFHPNFKKVPFINIGQVRHLMTRHLNDQYCKYGRTTIPQHKWIYERKLEFFKLKFKDIDRLYFFDEKKRLLCVRIEYKNKGNLFYVIFAAKRCIIYITSNPFLFHQHIIRLVKDKSIISSIYQLLNEDGVVEQSTSMKTLNEFCYNIICKNNNNKQLQSQISNLPPVIKSDINEFNACQNLVQYKYYFRKVSFQSRIFNKFTNKFLIDDGDV